MEHLQVGMAAKSAEILDMNVVQKPFMLQPQ